MSDQLTLSRETIRPVRPAQALAFTLSAFVITLAGFWSLFQAIIIVDPRWLAGSLASSVALFMLVDRKRQHDRLSFVSRMTYAEPPAMSKPAEVIRPEIQMTRPQSNTIRYGSIHLARSDWQRLGQAIFENDQLVTRDVIPAGIFTNLSKRYPTIVRELRRLGWLDERQRLTEAGRDWFSRFIPPHPIINDNLRSTRRPTTTTTETTLGTAAESWLRINRNPRR